MKNLKDKIMIAIFVFFLAFFSAGSFLFFNVDFSENENRYLQEFPSASAETIFDGSFEQNMEKYVSDRMTGRETLIGLKNSILKTIGTKDVGGVYFCDDNYYIEKKTDSDIDLDIYRKNLKAIALFYDNLLNHGISKEKLSFMPVPTAAEVLKEKLPANSPTFNELKVLEEAKTILKDFTVVDVTQSVAEIPYSYYKTDHHWTTDSAFASYLDWCESTGREKKVSEEFDIKIVSETFRGTLYSKVLCLDAAYDTVKVYVPSEIEEYTVVCDGKERELKYGFWDSSFEKKKDIYAGFYGGNYGLVHISKSGEEKNASVNAGGKLLVIKDSYANCFVPFLYGHFDDIYMVDLRYFNGNVSEFATENGITEVLSLFNISSFAEEKSIRKAGIL